MNNPKYAGRDKLEMQQYYEKSIIIALCASLSLNGCTTLHIPEYPSRSHKSYPNRVEVDGIAVAIEPIDDRSDLEQYFGVDLRAANVLPVFVFVANYGDKSFLLSREKIVLTAESDDPSALSDAIYEEDQDLSNALGVGGLVAIAALSVLSIPLILTSAKVGSDSKEINHNLAVKELRTKTVSPGQETNGFVYFSVPESDAALDRLVLQIIVTGTAANPIETIEIPLKADK